MPRQPRSGASVLLSIVIPSRNRPQCLRRTVAVLIGEIRAHRLEGKIEIIVADDASEPPVAVDLSDSIAAGALRVVRIGRQSGAAAARNAGVEVSAGEVIAFLDDDIVPAPDYLRTSLAFHRQHPEVLVVNGNLKPLRDDSYSRFWFHQYDAAFNRPGGIYPIAMLASGHCSLKRRLLELERPLFDASLPTREDTDLYLRLERHGVQPYKCDAIVAYNDCRNSLLGFVRQYAGYARGQQRLVEKHGSGILRRAAANPAAPPNWRLAHLYVILRLVRLLVKAS
ncbi:MAG TPA: glycosyltransferase family 2 protein [Terriglobales bacterium]|nr:glycosyltransferase family 2 protein [Terriglobales bacterium]